MNPHIITLPTGEAIAASAIVAVRKGDRETQYSTKDRVIIDYRVGGAREVGGWNSMILDTDTPEERDTLAASIIEQWKEATKQP